MENNIIKTANSFKEYYDFLFKNMSQKDLTEIYKSYYCVNSLPDSYVYLIKNHYNGYIKIGTSQDPYERLKQISSMLKNSCGIDEHLLDIISICYCPHNDGYQIENYFHKKFSKYKKYGEWYDFGDDYYDTIGDYFPEYINVMEYEDFKGVDIDGFKYVKYEALPLENFIYLLFGIYAKGLYEESSYSKETINLSLSKSLQSFGIQEKKFLINSFSMCQNFWDIYSIADNIKDKRLPKVFEYYMLFANEDNIGLCGDLQYNPILHEWNGVKLGWSSNADFYTYNKRISKKLFDYAFENQESDEYYVLKAVNA